ncbi:MAG: 5-formyltetrahydrofolate cyclo-ligase [Helicobacter sp.]|uniref:5-formyltetrahydrofolate cyclo-ligase n=1 Tax=Helicobacter sp. TaxID=218 RepID=UPI0023BDD942|nr:5-formyltetrahydrofolate cyclo-ligase [Helicobacter sp.]MDE5925222.1 5-formyltetrahydrofolate cyclo-ligase [Helicobacter sp.]MDE7174546.1 5-formyltetrahydrofolate cyclo-ligase [Helicobacter sp.]
MESQALKASYRKIFKANLIQICHSNQAYIKDYKLQKKLKAQLDSILRFHKLHSKRPINLLFYSPLALEFDIRKLLRFYRKKRNVRIFLPKMGGESFKAVRYRLPLQKQAFGVYEPSDSKFLAEMDCAIVPVLGVDKKLRRIGFGKGMYDRFFGNNPKKIPKIIFVSRNFNFAPQIITESHDIRGDCYLTPHQTMDKRDFASFWIRPFS